MKYGDLSSIVQLGVGLHVGTAVLQLYTELGMAPMERRMTRIRALFRLPDGEFPSTALKEEFEQLEGRYGLFKIRFFARYRWFVLANSITAAILAILLIVIAWKASDDVFSKSDWFAVFAISLSFVPAPLMLGILWWDARNRLAPLIKVADDIENRAITAT